MITTCEICGSQQYALCETLPLCGDCRRRIPETRISKTEAKALGIKDKQFINCCGAWFYFVVDDDSLQARETEGRQTDFLDNQETLL